MKTLGVIVLTAALVSVGAACGARTHTTCSASGLSAELPKQNLPAAVASVRARIAAAAVACDYAKLQKIALEKGQGFKFSYGSETSAASYWRKLESQPKDKPMARLVKILSIPYTRNETNAYAWPSAYTDNPTAANWNALVKKGVLTRAQVDAMRNGGNVYYGYRTAITPKGDWQFFVAGD